MKRFKSHTSLIRKSYNSHRHLKHVAFICTAGIFLKPLSVRIKADCGGGSRYLCEFIIKPAFTVVLNLLISELYSNWNSRFMNHQGWKQSSEHYLHLLPLFTLNMWGALLLKYLVGKHIISYNKCIFSEPTWEICFRCFFTQITYYNCNLIVEFL